MTTLTTIASDLPTIVVDLGMSVRGVFTGRGGTALPVGDSGNQSHHRPHRPDDLAAARLAACEAIGAVPADIVLMKQVHGVRVLDATDARTPAELDNADALVSRSPNMVLGVLTADCVPILLATAGQVGVAHAGRRGLVAGVIGAVLQRFPEPGRAAIGPAIRGCCYEVPSDMRTHVSAVHPAAHGTTSWGTPSLDLPRAAAVVLREAGWAVNDTGICTHHDDGHMSHRQDASTGRQVGLVRRVAA